MVVGCVSVILGLRLGYWARFNMGQKVNPICLRLGVINGWDSLWYAGRDYASKLHEDYLVRQCISRDFAHAAVAKVVIMRRGGSVLINLHTARPGVIMGKRGNDERGVDRIKLQVSEITLSDVEVNVVELKKPELSAVLVADNVARQLEKRMSFRRVMKKAVQMGMWAGAHGVKVSCAGRLGGAEIARTEWMREGRVPLHTLRANIDYGVAEALTTYGVIGVKVWIYVGEVHVSGKE